MSAEGAAAEGVGNPDVSETASESDRESLAADLKELELQLTTTYKKLTEAWPDYFNQEKTVVFWRRGLGDMRRSIDRMSSLLKRCKEFAKAEAKSQKSSRDDAYREPENGPDPLSEALTQLEKAIRQAREKTLAAHHSLEMPDYPWSADSRSKDFGEAAAQIQQLSFRCNALAVLVGGRPALERREAGAAQAETSAD